MCWLQIFCVSKNVPSVFDVDFPHIIKMSILSQFAMYIKTKELQISKNHLSV